MVAASAWKMERRTGQGCDGGQWPKREHVGGRRNPSSVTGSLAAGGEEEAALRENGGQRHEACFALGGQPSRRLLPVRRHAPEVSLLAAR